VRIMANPALLRALIVLCCAGFAFVLGLLSIRFFRQQIAEETNIGDQTPQSLDALPMHVYNTVIQQLKQQKHELIAQSQVEQQRAKSSELLNQAVLSNISSGVLVLGSNGLVKSFNPAAKRILGFASLVGMSAEDIFRGAVVRNEKTRSAAAEQIAVAEEVHSVLREGSQRRDLQGEYESPGGDRRFLALTVSRVTCPDDSLIGVICVITDLSEVEKMAQREQVHHEISAEMALKLRTSLRTISAYAEQLAVNNKPQLASQLAQDIAQEAAEIDSNIGGFLTSGHQDFPAASGAAAGS
jgi:PAS domain S-box-containing protein